MNEKGNGRHRTSSIGKLGFDSIGFYFFKDL